MTKWLVFCFWWRAPFFRPAFPALCRNQYSEDKALELKGLGGEGEWIDVEELANWTHLDSVPALHGVTHFHQEVGWGT